MISLKFRFWLILYPENLLNLLLILAVFFIAPIGFLYRQSCLLWIKTSFTSFLLIWMSFISCSCLIALAVTSSTVLNSHGIHGYPCLVPCYGGSYFIFKTITSVSFSEMSFVKLRNFTSICSLLRGLIWSNFENLI